jgi:hypothetical protein
MRKPRACGLGLFVSTFYYTGLGVTKNRVGGNYYRVFIHIVRLIFWVWGLDNVFVGFLEIGGVNE